MRMIVALVLVAQTVSGSANRLDCGMRRLMYQRALAQFPWRGPAQADVFAALQLNSECGLPPPDPIDRPAPPEAPVAGPALWVDASLGSDAHAGSLDRPMRSLGRAVLAMRRGGPRTIVLRAGVHYLNSTLELGPADSGLSIRAHPDEQAWLSGGQLLSRSATNWKSVGGGVFAADLSSAVPPEPFGVTGLFTLAPHRRMTLARYPNANVEDWNAQGRTLSGGKPVVESWVPPAAGAQPEFTFYELSEPNPSGAIKNDSTMGPYNTFATGKGGVCATVWGDGSSYWCSNGSAGGWAFVDQAAALAGRLNLPAGVRFGTDASTSRFERWADPRGGIFHVSHTQGWAWHMFNISGHQPDERTVSFDRGGWQGGRNWQCHDAQGHLSSCDGDDKKLGGGSWYVEGVMEELDAPGEFYFNRSTRVLYFWPNGTAEASPGDLVVPVLSTLIRASGSQGAPVANISITGIGFRDAAKTYMEQWGAPSGGDWALYRGGAVHLEGVKGVLIANCTFERLDGNALMLAGYAREVVIKRNEFKWIGDGAMATWGDTRDYDATQGDQPRGTLVEDNVVSEIGLYQKQSSFWGQAKACLTTLRNNMVFNVPRAAINFNDGLGGGNLVERNLIWNTCRESGDHGPINSWDRLPFLTDLTGIPSFAALPTHTQANFIFANYGGSQAFDNDDGSSFYHTHDNVFYSADGFKMDYGGHDSNFSNNLVVTLPYDGQNCINIGSFVKGHGDTFLNNTCVVTGSNNPKAIDKVSSINGCDSDIVTLRGNRYYTEHGNATSQCGNKLLTLKQMQAKGLEIGSSAGRIPDDATILQWAQAMLEQ